MEKPDCDHEWVKQKGVWTDGDYKCTKCEARMEKDRYGVVEIYGGKFYKWSNDEDSDKRDVLVVKEGQ